MVDLTIITVCKNAESTITSLLRSLECQIDQDFIHLIIDGSSTDRTLDIVKTEFNSKNRLIVSELDHGIFDAMNKGIELCSTSFFMFLNADDELINRHATSVINSHIKSTNKLLNIFGICYSHRENMAKSVIFYPPRQLVANDILIDKSLRRAPHPSSVYKKCDIRFKTDYKYAADLYFTLEYAKLRSVATHDQVISQMYRSNEQFSHFNRIAVRKESEIICENFCHRSIDRLGNIYRLGCWLFKNRKSVTKQAIRRLTDN